MNDHRSPENDGFLLRQSGIRRRNFVAGSLAAGAVALAGTKAWAQNQSIGIYAQAEWGLKIAVEKDFKCLDPRRDEDETDAFENPHAGGHPACPTVNE